MMTLLSVKQLADLLGTTPAAIYQRLARGSIPLSAIIRLDRLVRFDAVEIERWIESGRQSEATL
jgi:excisionase family DNA binding protein